MEQVSPFFYILWGILLNWGWIIIPTLLYRPFLFLWLWWRREFFWNAQKWILLEIKAPKEVLRPIKAMDQVFSSLWGNLYDPSDWWEKWIDGKELLKYSFEIASIGGETHFYIRLPQSNRNSVESSIYSQYPDAEISVVDDYVKYVPQDIPNKEWDLWGCDYKLLKDDVYPVKTYARFFEEKPDTSVEEKRIDPLSTLLEGLSRLQSGEQLWIQLTAIPVSNGENNYVTRGKAIIDKLARRPAKAERKHMLFEAAEMVITGQPAGAGPVEKESIIPPEMKLTPGEKDILAGVESKIGQYAFQCNMRFVYLGRRDVFFKPQIRTPFGHFTQFSTSNLNGFKPHGQPLITKVPKSWFVPWNLLIPRRLYIRKRKLFRNYAKRLPPFFPKPGGTFVLNTEELATLFHFPGRMVAPAPFVPRVESKRGEAPPGLPVEFE